MNYPLASVFRVTPGNGHSVKQQGIPNPPPPQTSAPASQSGVQGPWLWNRGAGTTSDRSCPRSRPWRAPPGAGFVFSAVGVCRVARTLGWKTRRLRSQRAGRPGGQGGPAPRREHVTVYIAQVCLLFTVYISINVKHSIYRSTTDGPGGRGHTLARRRGRGQRAREAERPWGARHGETRPSKDRRGSGPQPRPCRLAASLLRPAIYKIWLVLCKTN